MPKSGEIDYLRKLVEAQGESAIHHAVNKPFSDPECARHLAQFAAVLSLLPPPPARLLDLGCGTGWTSLLFARAGYDVVGADIAPDMIHHARLSAEKAGLSNVRFVECDYESLPFRDEFDCAVFYDALHHAIDEALAVRMAYQALKPGGVCVTSEPGEGHGTTEVAVEAVKNWGVTEKDMPPSKVLELGRRAGFGDFRFAASPWDLHRLAAEGWWQHDLTAPRRVEGGVVKRLFHGLLRRRLGVDERLYATMLAELPRLVDLLRIFTHRRGGIVAMVKGANEGLRAAG